MTFSGNSFCFISEGCGGVGWGCKVRMEYYVFVIALLSLIVLLLGIIPELLAKYFPQIFFIQNLTLKVWENIYWMFRVTIINCIFVEIKV